jgi:hypothetical protein
MLVSKNLYILVSRSMGLAHRKTQEGTMSALAHFRLIQPALPAVHVRFAPKSDLRPVTPNPLNKTQHWCALRSDQRNC